MIREIKQSDIPSLFDVRVQTRENQLTLEQLKKLGITEETISSELNKSLCGWLYEENSKTKGFTMGNKDNGEMTVIALLPECEGKGIGKQLLKKVEDWLKSQDWTEIWLTTDIDESLRAYGFYIKLGWKDSNIENGIRFMKKIIS